MLRPFSSVRAALPVRCSDSDVAAGNRRRLQQHSHGVMFSVAAESGLSHVPSVSKSGYNAFALYTCK